MSQSPWKLYDELIAGIPTDIAIKDYALGLNWSCVYAECGAGVSYTLTGGAKRKDYADFRKQSLKQLAELSKSWNMEEATLGIAALNAYYAQPNQLEQMGYSWEELSSSEKDTAENIAGGANDNETNHCETSHMDRTFDATSDSRPWKAPDAFEIYKPKIEAFGGSAKVVVVGHFPQIERMAEYCELTILERNCRSPFDTPDPACEYIIPEANFVFLTGVTLINKTAPRLLELAKDAEVIMVGPSVTPAQTLFDQGANLLASRVVLDPDWCLHSVKSGMSFGKSLQMINLQKL